MWNRSVIWSFSLLFCISTVVTDHASAEPIFSGNYSSPAFPANFNPNGNISFQINITESTDTSGNVTVVRFIIEKYPWGPPKLFLNNTNSATAPDHPIIQNVSNRLFFVNISQSLFGPADTYFFNWTASNSTGYSNFTQNQVVVLNKAQNMQNFLDVFLDGTPNTSSSVTYSTAVNVYGRFNSSFANDASFRLFVGNFIAANNSDSPLNYSHYPVGNNEFRYGSVSSMQNWTQQNTTNVTLTVSKGTLSNFLDVLIDGMNNNITTIYNGTGNNISGRFNSTGAGDITFNLYNQSSLEILNQSGLQVDRWVGSYIFVYGTSNTVSANWTLGNSTVRNLTITKGNLASFLNVSINGTLGNATFTYPNSTLFATGVFGSKGADDIYLYLFNSTSYGEITSQNGVLIDRSVGLYGFIYGTNFSSAHNWTVGNSTVSNMTINKGSLSSFLDVRIGGIQNNITQVYPDTGSNVSGIFNSKGAYDVSFYLFNQTSPSLGGEINFQNGSFINRTVGTYRFSYGTNQSNSVNWTTGNSSIKELNVTKGFATIKVYIFEAASSQTLEYLQGYYIRSNLTEGGNRMLTGADDMFLTIYRNMTLTPFGSVLISNESSNSTINVSGIPVSSGTHTFVANATSGQNWTTNSSFYQITFTRITPVITVLLDGLPSNNTYYVGDSINLTATTDTLYDLHSHLDILVNLTGSSNVSLTNTSGYNSLYAILNTTNMQSGTYRIFVNLTDPNINYTSAINETSIITLIDRSVSVQSSSGGGGGGGSFPTVKQYDTDGQPLYENGSVNLPRIKINEESKIEIFDLEIPITALSVSVREDTSNSTIKIKKTEESEIVIKLPKKVFSYIDIQNIGIEDRQIENATIGFKVENIWIRLNNVTAESVALYRFKGIWTRLDTKIIGRNPAYTYYESTSPGFSTFAIATETSEISIEPNISSAENEYANIPKDGQERIDWKFAAGLVTGIAATFLAIKFLHRRSRHYRTHRRKSL